MAVTNADLVDFFFMTRYLAKLAETENLKAIISDENRDKILKLYGEKLKDPSSITQLQKYRTESDLIAILNAFS